MSPPADRPSPRPTAWRRVAVVAATGLVLGLAAGVRLPHLDGPLPFLHHSDEAYNVGRIARRAVRAPLEALLAAVADEFGDGKVFRPYRDVRFSADKSPYKTQAAAILRRPSGGCYVAVSSQGLHTGAGLYEPSGDQLARSRAAVADDRAGGALVAIGADLAGLGLPLEGPSLKTAPRGYPRDHPRIDLLRHKGIIVMDHLPPGPLLHRPEVVDHVKGVWRVAGPLLDWLDAHVGPPEDGGRRVAARRAG